MNQEQNNLGSNGVPNNQPLNTNQVIGYNSQTGEPIYANQTQSQMNINMNQQQFVNQNNNPQIVGYNSQTGQPIYATNNMNNQNQVQGVQYATIGERFGAFFRDLLPVCLIACLGFFVITIIDVMLRLSGMQDSALHSILSYLKVLGPMLLIFYGQPIYAFFGDASSKHATKGKLKRNIYVLNKQGNYLTFGESFLRMLLKYVTLCIPFGIIITIILMSSTEKKQALHDLALGHTVVRK